MGSFMGLRQVNMSGICNNREAVAERRFQSSSEWGSPPVIDFKGPFVFSVIHGS